MSSSRHAHLVALLAEYKTATAEGKKVKARGIENQVIKENLPLVKKLVGKLIKRLVGPNHTDEKDLIQAGQIGMLKAWQRWVPEKGQFSTYASHWIRNEFQQCLGTSAPIYKPRNIGKPWQVHRKQEQIRARFGREATAEELGVTEEQLEAWRALPIVASIDECHAPRLTKGLHVRMGADTELTLHETVPDKRPNPEAAMEFAELGHIMGKALEGLTENEAYVIVQLFLEQRTFPEVAQAMGRREESVRRIRLAALSKLKEGMSI